MGLRDNCEGEQLARDWELLLEAGGDSCGSTCHRSAGGGQRTVQSLSLDLCVCYEEKVISSAAFGIKFSFALVLRAYTLWLFDEAATTAASTNWPC